MDNSIQAHQKELCNKLWAMANALRGNMEAYEFKNYILGMIFYYYLSDRTEKYMANLLKDDGISYEDAWADEEYKEAVVEEALRDLGFIIEPQFLFCKMVKMVENRSFDIEFLQKAINALMESTLGNDSQEDFDGLFSDMQLDSTKLGHTVKDRSAVMSKIIASLDEINFGVEDTKIDVLGNAYEYLIGQFAATAGKKAGEFYTPSGPAELLCRLACLGLTDVKDAADPTCGSGSLLLRLKNYANVRNYYGQELTSTTYNLARMNMILRGIPYRNFNIYNGDTLEHDYFGDMKFRVLIVDDERGIVDMIQSYFQTQYDILTAYSGQEALKKVACKPDLILLDINMPGMDGLTVCQQIREHIACPILFLTARIESSDKIIGFQAGADDYIVKPFDLDELGARIAAHLRREQRRQNNSAVRFFGELILDYSARTVTINNLNIPLSKREFEIVELLSLNAGQVFDRERIYELVWGLDGDGNSDTIMEHIRKIRAKFAAHTLHNYIETVWGCGYRWNA